MMKKTLVFLAFLGCLALVIGCSPAPYEGYHPPSSLPGGDTTTPGTDTTSTTYYYQY